MAHLKGRHADASDGQWLLALELNEIDFVAAGHPARAGEQDLGGADEARGNARWADHGERGGALADMLGVNEPPHQPRKVVAVQMRDENGADRVRVEVEAPQTDQHGGPADEQKVATSQYVLKAGLRNAA